MLFCPPCAVLGGLAASRGQDKAGLLVPAWDQKQLAVNKAVRGQKWLRRSLLSYHLPSTFGSRMGNIIIVQQIKTVTM